MHGNLNEWCRDQFLPSPPGGTDPEVAMSSTNQVVRGGSRIYFGRECQSSKRMGLPENSGSHMTGFRVALVSTRIDQTPIASNGPFAKPAGPAIVGPGPVSVPFDEAAAKAGQKAWADFLGQETTLANSYGMKLHLIPPGRFMMGEKNKQVLVTLSLPFYLAETEVTQAQWTSLMPNIPWKGQFDVRQDRDLPAEYVNWDEVQRFCSKLTDREAPTLQLPRGWVYALPTEAQWEYACRAGTETRFSFGDDPARLNDYGWYRDNTFVLDKSYAHKVAQKLPNAFGLYDMHGNVMEWCQDGYRDKLMGGWDPKERPQDTTRVCRGGTCQQPHVFCTAAFRHRNDAAHQSSQLGFRVALVPPNAN
jgi:formylglycine-generating enzyme required for sulfatase activity